MLGGLESIETGFADALLWTWNISKSSWSLLKEDHSRCQSECPSLMSGASCMTASDRTYYMLGVNLKCLSPDMERTKVFAKRIWYDLCHRIQGRSEKLHTLLRFPLSLS